MQAHKIVVLEDLKKQLSLFLNDNLKDVILFGSQLQEDSNTNSEYDILIVLKKKSGWKIERLISDICYDIDLKHNIITDTHILSEEELNSVRGKQPVFINALNKGFHA